MRNSLHCLTANEMVPLRLGTLHRMSYLQGIFRSDSNYFLFHKNIAVRLSPPIETKEVLLANVSVTVHYSTVTAELQKF